MRARIASATLLLAPLLTWQAQVLLVLTPQVRVLAPSQGLLGLPGMLPGLLLGLLVLVLILLLASSPGAVRVLAEALMVRSPMRSKDSAQAQVLVQQLWAPAVTTYQTVSDNCDISTSWIIMASALGRQNSTPAQKERIMMII